jgi:peptide/nickel transport system substrate-binding protein
MTGVRWRWCTLALGAMAMAVAGCGGGDGGNGDDGADGSSDGGDPVYGGEMVYALEADNSGGWCLPESQLAVSGIMVARAVYDTLTVPNEDGEYVPFLAESVEPNEDYTQWTITLREGVTFHDGTPLDATVVKNNLDAYRGAYPGRTPLLLRFAFGDVAAVDVVDGLTVRVTTSRPWPSFRSYLYYTGRVGIMGQAQLDDPESCDSELVGTGPFVQKEWIPGERFSAERNPDYWATDGDGNQLPYLDAVDFVPFPDGPARTNSLLSGEFNAAHTSNASQTETLEAEAEAGNVELLQSVEYAEVEYGMLNASEPPFDDPMARELVALAFNREQVNDVVNLGRFEVANGPFAPGEVGHLEDSGWPEYDLEAAKELAEQYEEANGAPLEFTLTTPTSGTGLEVAQLLQQQAQDVGVTMNVESVEQATLISRAIGGDYEAITFRNHPGGDPDNQYVWWYGKAPTNFGRFDDPEVNALLDQGRVEADPAARAAIYEEINREFAREFYNLWLTWTEWTVATAPEVRAIAGPPNPDGSGPFPGLADGHSLAGAWIAG